MLFAPKARRKSSVSATKFTICWSQKTTTDSKSDIRNYDSRIQTSNSKIICSDFFRAICVDKSENIKTETCEHFLGEKTKRNQNFWFWNQNFWFWVLRFWFLKTEFLIFSCNMCSQVSNVELKTPKLRLVNTSLAKKNWRNQNFWFWNYNFWFWVWSLE